MKKLSITLLMALLAVNVCYSANNDKEVEKLKVEIQKLSSTQKTILKEVESIKNSSKQYANKLNELQTTEDALTEKVDSLDYRLQELAKIQTNDRDSFQNGIQATNNNVAANLGKMDTRTMWGGGLLALVIIVFSGYLFIMRRKNSTSMDEVRKAQEALQTAQTKMQEDSIKLDNQMLKLVEKQMNAVPVMATQAETDHSLALKVADETVRIELNLSRMDSSVKGYKQLSKAVERIRNNFAANGYEIVEMLGKPYNEGMRVIANFVPDDTLAEGDQKITGVTKPQINYNGIMIQKAQVTVSQNI